MKLFEKYAVGTGRTRVEAQIYEIGSDLLVLLGGEGIHIGAATLAEPLTPGDTELTTLCARGHREPELTTKLAQAISDATGRRTLAVAGIHVDLIKPEEIQAIRRNLGALIVEVGKK